ncbi:MULTISPECIES: hypothetical protein [Methanobacterium]|jgi:hypothetical protein|uniref:Uncharacterized protein n=1 Tax=Methanobacterium veterum TaxID=408577 RepID=A0A9E5A084_9EURY|nr:MULTISPECIES: hypothetical protein [Methanobacterium]MCZ3364512.1 hypothetical protein [Methanobacterium veterum]MCZ3372265.1 hypothetical protein [Methanobacterium veterum]
MKCAHDHEHVKIAANKHDVFVACKTLKIRRILGHAKLRFAVQGNLKKS